MAYIYNRGEPVRVPITITDLTVVTEDNTFKIDIWFPSNTTTTPDETFDYIANPTNFQKIGAGKYIFTRPTTLLDEQGDWILRINLLPVGGSTVNVNEVVVVR